MDRDKAIKYMHDLLRMMVQKDGSDLFITMKDYGKGIPTSVKGKLFKEMITTKGKDGTGLGLYMSYATIKARFNGDMKFNPLPNEVSKATP